MEQQEIKMTEEELQKIQDLRTQYASITAQLGQLKIEQMFVNRQLSRLKELEAQFEADYMANQTAEEVFAKQINEKYGDGDINLDSGVFTPVSPSVRGY